MRTLLVCENGLFQRDVAPAAISDHRDRPNTTIWLDIDGPTSEDMELLAEEFGTHPLALEDIANEAHQPKVDTYDDHYFLIFYAANPSPDGGEAKLQSIHILVGPNYLVSIHRGPVRQIEQTLARWQRPASPITNKVGALLYALIDTVVDGYFPVIDEVGDAIDDVQDTLFNDFRDDTAQTLFQLKRRLMGLRRVVGPQRDIINTLLRRELPIFSESETIYLQDIYDHLVRVAERIESYRELLSSSLDLFLSMQSNRLNQTLKVMTVTSIILMADALIAGIYGMNFEFMPELSWPYGYPFAIGLMLTVSLGLLLIFKRIRLI